MGTGWIVTARTGGVSRGAQPLWLWVSNRGEQHPCWHTTFLRKSSVLYLCGADYSRNCCTPRKVRLQLRRSGGKGCPLRGSINDRKRLAGGAGMHCLPAVSFAEQRYIKAPSASAYHRVKTTTAASRAGCPSPRPPPSLSGSRSDGNGAPRRSAGVRFHR